MLSSIFIKTWENDLKWLEWALKFLDKNWTDISTLYIMAPNNCHERIRAMDCYMNPSLLPMDEWPNGYLGQQFFKMNADLYCDGEYITFIDSDTMLLRETQWKDLCDDRGRPIIWYTPYKDLGDTVIWREVVRQAMLLEPDLEFMRCHPFTYHRDTIKGCRQHLERLHATTLATIIQNSRGFTEFNTLGFYSYIFERNSYDFREAVLHPSWNGARVRQFFSYGDWNAAMPEYLERLLNPPVDRIEVTEPDDAQLFICTWENDLEWLEYNLRSCDRYWRSRFKPLVIATEECRGHFLTQTGFDVIYEPKWPDHHRGQIWIKMNADRYAGPEPEIILFMDSDCLFTRESRYQDFTVNGKPIIHFENYDTLIPRVIPQDKNCFEHYRQVVKDMLDIDAPAEYMRQQPFVFYKGTIQNTRATIENRHRLALIQLMERYHSGYFSEFNLLAAYAWARENERYHFAPTEEVEDRRVHQFHSYSQKPQTNEIVTRLLAESVKPKKTRKRKYEQAALSHSHGGSSRN